MHKLEAEYRVVTPLFAGGAEQEAAAELRAPAFKGVLRFWYRAVALPFYNGDWQEVKKSEKMLFGSTDGQSSFMLKLNMLDPPGEQVDDGTRWDSQGSAYLGYGVIKRKGRQDEVIRPYLKEGFRFMATLVMPGLRGKKVDIEGLKKALIALGLCGGLGSRSRKGFGSLALESLVENDKEIWRAPGDASELQARIKEMFQGTRPCDAEPEYSAFSGSSRVAIWPSRAGALQLLDGVGREMVRYRSYGQKRNGRRVVLGNEKAEQIFADDHNLVWSIVQGEKKVAVHPRRVVFGLPHNYFFFSTRQKVDVNAALNQRRASPLFIHIHQLTSGCAAVFTLLPARFLPPGDEIEINAMGKNNRVTVPPNVDYEWIHEFINRFPGRLEVLP